jgi:hypothetical protein
LTLGALGVFEELAEGGLAHVEIGVPLQVAGGDLLVSDEVHDPPVWQAASAILAKTRTASPCTPTGKIAAERLAGLGRACEAAAGMSSMQTASQPARPRRKSTARPRGVATAAEPLSTWERNAS